MRSDLAAVAENGLTIRSTEEPTIRIDRVQTYGDTREIGPVDLVLIATKTTSNRDLETLLPPLLHADTALVTLQNGLGNEAFLAERFGERRVMGALCFVCLNRVAPGVIEHYGHGAISIGECKGAPLPRTEALAAALRDAGIAAKTVENLLTERWRKLVWNIPFNGLSIAAGELTTADILSDPGLAALSRKLMQETVAVARANGHDIPDSYVDFQMDRTPPMGPYKPSSLLDYTARRPVEVEAIWGEPYRQALAAGAEAPRLETLYFLLKTLTARHQS